MVVLERGLSGSLLSRTGVQPLLSQLRRPHHPLRLRLQRRDRATHGRAVRHLRPHPEGRGEPDRTGHRRGQRRVALVAALRRHRPRLLPHRRGNTVRPIHAVLPDHRHPLHGNRPLHRPGILVWRGGRGHRRQRRPVLRGKSDYAGHTPHSRKRGRYPRMAAGAYRLEPQHRARPGRVRCAQGHQPRRNLYAHPRGSANRLLHPRP